MNLVLFVLILTSVDLYVKCISGHCLHGNASSCAFECHCANDSECGGVCVSGCNTAGVDVLMPWSGDTCQMGNIAYSKTATQSTTSDGYIASKAVDGRISKDMSSCTHTDEPIGLYPEWKVDLGGLYIIYNIIIHNRRDCCQVRLGYLNITIIDGNNNETECARYEKLSAQGDLQINLACHTPLLGRYVKITKYKGPFMNVLTLCEVVVIGHQYKDALCNNTNGICLEGCLGGFHGPGCQEECGRCAEGQCHQWNGTCPNCDLWWIDDKCKTEIVIPEYRNETINENFTSSTAVSVLYQLLKSIPANLSEYYQYCVVFKEQRVSNYTEVLVQPHTAATEQTAVIEGLLHNVEYIISIVPQRVMRGTVEDCLDAQYTPISVKTKCPVPDTSALNIVAERQPSANDRMLPMIRLSISKSAGFDADCFKEMFVEYKAALEGDYHSLELSEESTYTIRPLYWDIYEIRVTLINDQDLRSFKTVYIPIEKHGSTVDRDILGYTGIGLFVTLMVSIGVCASCISHYRKKIKRLKRKYEHTKPPEISEDKTQEVVMERLYSN